MTVKTIVLKGNDLVVRKESIALGTITPGMLVERTSTGIQAHSGAAKAAANAFAVENEVVGKGISDNYATSDTVLFGVCPSGVEIYAVVSGSIAIGDFLESDGAGGLRKAATDSATDDTQRHSTIAVAISINASTRAKVEIL